MKRIELHRNGVRAALLFAAKQDIRYYLIGLKVEATSEATRVIGTNGHVLGMHHSAQENELAAPTELIVPYRVAAMVKAAPRKRAAMPVTLESEDGETWTLRDSLLDFALTFRPIEGKFPDTIRVIPKETSGVAARYQTKYLALAETANRVLTGDDRYGVNVSYNGDAGGLVHIVNCPEFIGVLMPMRMEGSGPTKRPEWADASLMTVKAAAPAEAVPA